MITEVQIKHFKCIVFLHVSLVAVGNLAKLSDRHWLLLNVVLSEKARLACHHLLNGCRYHQIVYIIIGTSRLPFLWWDNLGGENWKTSYSVFLNTVIKISKSLDVRRTYLQHMHGRNLKNKWPHVCLNYAKAKTENCLISPLRKLRLQIQEISWICKIGMGTETWD